MRSLSKEKRESEKGDFPRINPRIKPDKIGENRGQGGDSISQVQVHAKGKAFSEGLTNSQF